MKNITLTVLCCCALLTACDKSSDAESEADASMLDKAGSLAKDTASAARDATEQAAGDLDSALESAKAAADNLAESAIESAGDAMVAGTKLKDTAVDSVKELSSTAVVKSGEMIAAVTNDDANPGESIYKSKCIACHGAGIAGAPKLGDKTAWDARIAQGNAILSQHAIEGYKGATGFMPAKGGYMDLKDEEVSLAVMYMVSQVQ